MCVIAYVERGREINKKEFLTCFQANPDGAGLMYQDKKKGLVHIKKGFMNFDEFWDVATSLPTDTERVFHFRIATSGKISQGVCHPFPVCQDYKTMKRLDVYTPKGMVHNGVIHEFTPKEGLKADYSDTMAFNKDIIYPLGNAIFNQTVQDLISTTYGCRYVVMSSDNVAIIGDWVQSKESGILYSNSSYQSYPLVYGVWDEPQYDYSQFIEVFTGGVPEEHKKDMGDRIVDELWEQGIDVYDWYWEDFSYIAFVETYEDSIVPRKIAGFPIEHVKE